MANLNLIYYPCKILSEKSREISDYVPEKYKQLIEDMSETMQKNKGIGLAAPQIGKNIRIAVIQTKDGIVALINPEIVKHSLGKETGEEGCLSIPGVFGMVKRYKKITVSAIMKDGTKKVFNAQGLLARVIQHEIDHLDGILFIGRTKKIISGNELLKSYARGVKTR